MGTAINVLSLTIILAMILSNVIDIKESQACGGWSLDDMASAAADLFGGAGRSLQSLGISLSIKIFLDNIQFYFHTFV